MIHESHDKVLNRLKRAHGHLHKILDMMEKEQSCVDIAQQLYAVESAVQKAKKILIQDHIDHCLESAVLSGRKSDEVLAEFKEISKYL